jgi:hypothetical protein
MGVGTYLGYIGGALAVVAGTVSTVTLKPLITHLTGISLIEGNILVWLGHLGIIGGLVALYFAYKGNGLYTMIGGLLGLTAPCGLSILAVIGGYLMQREGARGG